MNDTSDVDRVAQLAHAARARVAVAESLTAGRICAALGAGEDASTWFAGGVVAYDEDVKFEVLGVSPGPVVTESCARQMAVGVRALLKADVAVGITGAGGPGEQEGQPPGTVFIAVSDHTGTRSFHAQLSGDPPAVVAAATNLAVEELTRALRRLPLADDVKEKPNAS